MFDSGRLIHVRFSLRLSSLFLMLRSSLQGLCLIVFLTLSISNSAQAMPAWPFNVEEVVENVSLSQLSPNYPSGNLNEVAPPGAVQQIRNRLDDFHPRISLESPLPESVLKQESWELVLNLQDWPLSEDSELGIGPHVVVQVDDLPPARVTRQEDGKIHVPMKEIGPGSHRVSAYVSYPWGEAVKDHGASLQFRVHVLQKVNGTQPEQDEPWLTVVSPSELNKGEPLLIDGLIWNAPLQGLKEGDARWRLRVTIDGDSFLMDRQEPIWIEGIPNGSHLVQFELLDELGEPLNPYFNNQLINVNKSNSDLPIWLQDRLNDINISRLLGEDLQLSEINLLGDEKIEQTNQSIEENKDLIIHSEPVELIEVPKEDIDTAFLAEDDLVQNEPLIEEPDEPIDSGYVEPFDQPTSLPSGSIEEPSERLSTE